jgi:hypothetical protein
MRYPEEPRTLVRAVRWSPCEWDRICVLTARAGIRPSSYIRGAALREEHDPPKAPRTGRTRFAEPRGIERSIRFHETEWERVVRLAEVVVLPPDRFVREAAVGYRLHSRADAEVVRQLARWGNNLNQLTRLAHSEGLPPGNEFHRLAVRLRDVLDRLL